MCSNSDKAKIKQDVFDILSSMIFKSGNKLSIKSGLFTTRSSTCPSENVNE